MVKAVRGEVAVEPTNFLAVVGDGSTLKVALVAPFGAAILKTAIDAGDHQGHGKVGKVFEMHCGQLEWGEV